MLIRAGGVSLHVTGVKTTMVRHRDIVTRCGFLWLKKDIKTVYDVWFSYIDQNGRDAEFEWVGADERKDAEAIENQLLSQIKEVELEHISQALENAIRNS
jgi:hypothetical protein